MRTIRSVTCSLLLCFLALDLSAIEGVDDTTGGDWNTPTTTKPWSYDGQNRYGTAGYHFYNVTPLGGRKQADRPVEENLKSSLPSYVKSITPSEGSYTSHSFGYLEIDAPWDAEGSKVESGLLAKMPDDSGVHTDLLTLNLDSMSGIYGFRVGILIASADRENISPQEIMISNENKRWSRSAVNLRPYKGGLWVFFNVPAKHANESLVLSVKPNSNFPAAIAGLVFDDLSTKPPEQPINVVSEAAVTQTGHVVWDAAPTSDAKESSDESWEHALAMKLSNEYRQNAKRIESIREELDQLPKPYTGEPTGTGGYLSHWSGSRHNEVSLNFRWNHPVSIDAVALLPLRLFLADEKGLTDNAYWPGEISIESIEGDDTKLLTTITSKEQQIQESLPTMVSFQPHTTKHLRITLSNLSKRIGGYQFAGGFSEICIFSGQDNIATRAKIAASSSREGFRVFSKDYLVDGNTPLGLPEIGPRKSGGLGISIRPIQRRPTKDISLRLEFEEETLIDSVRMDPAVIYKPGQAFPVRFTIELIGSDNQVIQSDLTYKNTPLRNPGLNPYFCYFQETIVKAIHIQIYESSKPTTKARPWIQISEITPIFQGEHVRNTAKVIAAGSQNRSALQIYDPSGRQLFWKAETVYDGQTQTGSVLPIREWLEGLSKRQDLLLEEREMNITQGDTLRSIRVRTLWAICLFLVLVVLLALYIIIRAKVLSRRELRKARERIASDLHDHVGSNLGTITLHTEFLIDQADTPAQQEHLKAITQLTRESVYGLREVLHTSAPRIGRAQNILEYVEELGQLVLPDTELKIALDPAANTALKTPEVRKGILLYYKEALTNIRSHAQCQQVSVSLSEENNHLELIIEDDGIGMPPEKLSRERTLRTLKLRANEMQATLNIISKVDVGTRLELKIPLR